MNNSENKKQPSDEDVEFSKYQHAVYETFLKDEEARYENDLLRINEDRIKRIFQYATKCSEKTNNEKFDKIFKVYNLWSQITFREDPAIFYDDEKSQFKRIMTVQLELLNIIYSSIFLAFIGHYRPAFILLRQWLELYITSIRYDLEFQEDPKNKTLKDDIENWLSGGKEKRFVDTLSLYDKLGISENIIKRLNKNNFPWYKNEKNVKEILNKLWRFI